MSHVPPTRRLLRVLLGYVAAVLAGGMIPLGGYMILMGVAYGSMITMLLPSAALTFLKIAGIALLPTAIIMAIVESFSIRAVLVYVLLGVSVFIGCTIYLVTRDGLAFSFAVLSAMTSAGIVAGLVYWWIAGRDAGAWRRVKHRP